MKVYSTSIVISLVCLLSFGCDSRVSGPTDGDEDPFTPGGAPFAGTEFSEDGDETGGSDEKVRVACGFVDSDCDDGDDCTVKDACAADGICRGEPITCDDEVSCTMDECQAGNCVHTVIDGFCFIDQNCWSEGQSSPEDDCLTCQPFLQPETWSDSVASACVEEGCSANAECDDDDPCTVDTCAVGGECVNTPQQGLCEGCTSHADCDDGDECTQDTCGVDGNCVNTVVGDDCGNPECTTDLDCAGSGPCMTVACVNNSCVQQPTTGACDDGDSCTSGDTCSNGVCQGSALNCDDGDSCTTDACSQGSCVHIPQAEPGATEICDDGLDNDCNGLTDGQDSACPSDVPTPCTYHEDCYPEQLCGYWPTFGDNRCSDPCGGPQECDSGLICGHVPGSANLGYCRTSFAAMGLSMGQQCSTNGDCESEVCAAGICGYLCGDEGYCNAPLHTCYPGGDLNTGFNGVCGADSTFPGGKMIGTSCSSSGECLSSHCDLLSFQPKCAPLCSSDAECNQEQECGLIIRSSQPIAETIPFAAIFMSLTYDAISGCFARPTAANGMYGMAETGTVCTDPIQCRSNKCFALKPGDNTMWCTSFCAIDGDCPMGMVCKQDVVNLASNYLVADEMSLATGYTFVRLCKWE